MPKLPLPAGLRKPSKPGEGGRNGAGRNGKGANGAGAEPTGLVEKSKEGAIDVVGWVDERTGASPFLTAMLLRHVPKGTNWFYTLGSATLFAFLAQAITGVFLAMYYVPDSTSQAYASITHLTNDVFLGEFVRGLHKWGASVMIILIFLHMGRTFFFGAEFGSTTLPRFYAMHMLLLPGAIFALIGAHLYLVVKLGTTAPPWLRADPKPKPLREEQV